MEAAAELLRFCAFLAPDAIPEEALTAGASHLGPVLSPVAADALLLSQAMEALRAYSLIKRDPERKTLSIHRLVQAVLQDSLEETQRRTQAERALCAVNATFPAVEHGTWPQCERLLPQAVTVAQVVEQYQFVNREAGRLLCIWEQLGPQHPETAEIIHDLARFWEAQDNGEEASAWYARALAVREPALGAHHPKTTETRKRFIALLHALGQHEEAAQLEAIQFEQ